MIVDTYHPFFCNVIVRSVHLLGDLIVIVFTVFFCSLIITVSLHNNCYTWRTKVGVQWSISPTFYTGCKSFSLGSYLWLFQQYILIRLLLKLLIYVGVYIYKILNFFRDFTIIIIRVPSCLFTSTFDIIDFIFKLSTLVIINLYSPVLMTSTFM